VVWGLGTHRGEGMNNWRCRWRDDGTAFKDHFLPQCFSPETNACLIHHGGCHIHADCIPTGPQQVSGVELCPSQWVGPPFRPGLEESRVEDDDSVQGAGSSWPLAAPLIRIWDRSPAAAARATVVMAFRPVTFWTSVPRSGSPTATFHRGD
jgi:hypothetical protein